MMKMIHLKMLNLPTLITLDNMKPLGIFWLIVIGALYYLAYTFGIWFLVGAYAIWYSMGLIIHNNIDDINILTDSDTIDEDDLKELFLGYPYLFTLIHLFFIGFCCGIAYGLIYIIKHAQKYIKKMNNTMDSVSIKDIKTKLQKPDSKNFKTFVKDSK